VTKRQPGDAVLLTGPVRRRLWMAWPPCVATAISFPEPDLDTAIDALLEPHPWCPRRFKRRRPRH